MDMFLDIYKPTLVKATSNLNNQEKMLLHLIATKVGIAKDFTSSDSYTFKLDFLYSYLGMEITESYEPFNQFASILLSKTIEFRKGRSFLVVGWISSVQFNTGTKEVSFKFNPYMLSFYQHLRDYFDVISV